MTKTTFDKVFESIDDKYETRIPISINGITVAPAIKLGPDEKFKGFQFDKLVGKNLHGYVENGIFLILGYN